MLEFTWFVHCPRCGRASIEVHQKNAMRCTVCGYVYFHNTCAATAGIIETGDGVLLTVRAHKPKAGTYDLPGGFVDYNESIEDALRREIREELGIDVAITAYLGSFPNRYVYRDVVYFTADSFFVCRPIDEVVPLTGSEELRRWEIFPVDKLPFDKIGFESNVKALGLYRRFSASR
ncbi:MAG: NUDIX domain-containing protein [Chitinispirillaceae bacterium]|nr:NUDIX domain-containing protein [Chitinispirillaceae bacterium]